MLTRDMKDLLRAFNASGVEYLVIGGYAYGVYQEPRATKDLDLFIRSDPKNAKAVFEALAQFGYALVGPESQRLLRRNDLPDGHAAGTSRHPAKY